MYKVLFADDEPIALEGLQLMAEWEELGFEVCGQCENGEEALAAVERCLPDLILTDIRMPGLDGLELIEQVRQLKEDYDPIFVIMSGYSDFEYAKTALRQGVRHYLLKPVLDEEWESILSDIMNDLNARTRQKSQQERFSKKLLSAVLAQILRGELQELDDELAARMVQLDREAFGWRYILIEGLKSESLEFCKALPFAGKVMFIDLYASQVGLVADASQDIVALAGQVYQELLQNGTACCVSIGPRVSSLKELTRSYTGALEASVQHFFQPEAGPVDYETMSHLEVSYRLEALPELQAVLTAAERKQEEEAREALERLFEQFYRSRTAPEVVQTLLTHLMMKTIEVMRELGMPLDEWPKYRTFIEGEPKSLSALEQAARAYLTDYMKKLKAFQESHSTHPVRNIERYIQEHFRKPLTIKEIGERFFMNPVYLGQAFMKKNGVGIIEYIHDLRIEDAKRMLVETDQTIRSIAEEVGYVHYHHFLREFEKRVAEKPAVYRQLHKT